MMNAKLFQMMNQQLNRELYSSYLYLAIASYYSKHGLNGFAHWFKAQAREELEHALKFHDFIIESGRVIHFMDIAKPEYDDFSNLREPLSVTLAHERKVTAWIREIYDFAVEIDNQPVVRFLDWFIKEQHEEEENAEKNLAAYESCDIDGDCLKKMDKTMGKR